MIRIGLSSSALLTRNAQDIIAAAKAAGLDAIEWAGELHVPHDDPGKAEKVMMDTLRAGLTTAAYAPLYRAKSDGEAGLRFEAILKAASILQAPLVRIFLGGPSGASLDPQARSHLVEEARRLGDSAAKTGLTLCLSFGRNTSLERYPATLDLVAEIDHPFIRLAWEPLPDAKPDEASAALESAGRSVAMVIARHVGRDGVLGSLADEVGIWRRRIAAFKKAEMDPKMGQFVVIGAVRDDAGAGPILPGLAEDVQVLKRLVAEIETKPV